MSEPDQRDEAPSPDEDYRDASTLSANTWPTLQDLLSADGGNVQVVETWLREFHPDLPALLEEGAALYRTLARATDTDYSGYQGEFSEIGRTIGGPAEELAPMMHGKVPVPDDHPHRSEILRAQELSARAQGLFSKGLVLLMIGRAYLWAATDLLRQRVTPAFGYMRIQVEGVALLHLFEEDPFLSKRWLDAQAGPEGVRFYHDTRERIGELVNALGLRFAYETSTSSFQHVRLAGAAWGFRQSDGEERGRRVHEIGLSFQEVDPDDRVPFYDATLFVLDTQRLVFNAMPGIVDAITSEQRIPGFGARVQEMKARRIELYGLPRDPESGDEDSDRSLE